MKPKTSVQIVLIKISFISHKRKSRSKMKSRYGIWKLWLSTFWLFPPCIDFKLRLVVNQVQNFQELYLEPSVSIGRKCPSFLVSFSLSCRSLTENFSHISLYIFFFLNLEREEKCDSLRLIIQSTKGYLGSKV